MLGRALTGTLHGADALAISVEAHVALGLPAFITVGLPDLAVRESRVRVEAALKNSGLTLPSRRVLINLAPADVRKEGSSLDLAIAVAVLAGHELVSQTAVDGLLFVGELGLEGHLRPVNAIVIYAQLCRRLGLRGVVVPIANASLARLVPGVQVYAVESLNHLLAALRGDVAFAQVEAPSKPSVPTSTRCFSQVRGQVEAKRALELAATGGHHILLSGPPGVGKTMLCERAIDLLPNLDEEAAIEVMAIHSLLDKTPSFSLRPPLRAPHHSLSTPALIGGGSQPHPGEISLAHHGILFLDELAEFRREAINGLRQPIEAERVTIARSSRTIEFRASFQLVAATNPCPCGYLGHPVRACQCSSLAVERYRLRLAGPIVDRFDLQLRLAPELSDVTARPSNETSATIAERVRIARAFAKTRGQTTLNVRLAGDELTRHCRLTGSSQNLLYQAAQRLQLSARAIDRTLRVSRTVADLAGADDISESAIAEALVFRNDGRTESTNDGAISAPKPREKHSVRR